MLKDIFKGLCLAERIDKLRELTDTLKVEQKSNKKQLTELASKQDADITMVSDALCDMDVATEERLTDIENALCDIAILVEEGSAE